jgi:acetyltransferase-like isoleucine patch superfamily enzyme
MLEGPGMTTSSKKEAIQKASGGAAVADEKTSSIQKYVGFFVGRSGWGPLVKYEMITCLCGLLPGAIGYLLRKKLYPGLIGRIGSGVQWGRNVSLRHPGKMEIGDRTAIDEGSLLDARGVEAGQFRIGSDVLIARDVVIQSKTDHGIVEVGDRTILSNGTTISSAGGVRIGRDVLIAAHCYIGGGRYHTEDTETPMVRQGLYTTGQVVIGDDVWIGAGARILDGVTIGRGTIVGAGAVVQNDLPEYTVVSPFQKLVMLPRKTTD